MSDNTIPDMSNVAGEIQNLAKTPKEFRQINTFMKRRTHLSQKAESALLDERFHHILVNPETLGKLGDVSQINDLRELFANTPNGKTAPLVLEIGFGMGGSLVEMAKNDPNSNFVGIEVHEPGIGNCVALAFEQNLTNLKVINGDAIALLKQLPPNHIDCIQLFFPDPWQKKRHYKRRFVVPERMQIVADSLTVGGQFWLATDWEHYAQWSLEVLDNMPIFKNSAGVGNFAPRPDARPMTKFEKRGVEKGHGVWDLIYQKRQ